MFKTKFSQYFQCPQWCLIFLIMSNNIIDFMPRMYVARIYDDWFVGNVIEISEQYNKIHVKFMKKMENAFCGPLKMTHVGFLCSISWDM